MKISLEIELETVYNSEKLTQDFLEQTYFFEFDKNLAQRLISLSDSELQIIKSLWSELRCKKNDEIENVFSISLIEDEEEFKQQSLDFLKKNTNFIKNYINQPFEDWQAEILFNNLSLNVIYDTPFYEKYCSKFTLNKIINKVTLDFKEIHCGHRFDLISGQVIEILESECDDIYDLYNNLKKQEEVVQGNLFLFKVEKGLKYDLKVVAQCFYNYPFYEKVYDAEHKLIGFNKTQYAFTNDTFNTSGFFTVDTYVFNQLPLLKDFCDILIKEDVVDRLGKINPLIAPDSVIERLNNYFNNIVEAKRVEEFDMIPEEEREQCTFTSIIEDNNVFSIKKNIIGMNNVNVKLLIVSEDDTELMPKLYKKYWAYELMS